MAQSEIIEGTPIEILPRLKSLPSSQRYRLVPVAEPNAESRPFYETATASDWISAWHKWTGNHDNDAPLLSDVAVSRDSIYQGRG